MIQRTCSAATKTFRLRPSGDRSHVVKTIVARELGNAIYSCHHSGARIVGFWHDSDLPRCLLLARFWGQSGNEPAVAQPSGAAASDYLAFFALVAQAYMWARTARVALAKQAGDNTGFYKAKLATARFFMARVLPQQAALFQMLGAGKQSLMELEAEAF